MPLTPQLINTAVERYWREFDRYEKLSEFVGDSCRKLLEENGIRGSVQWRAKNPDRLRAKLQKYLNSSEHFAEFVDLDGVFRVLKYLAGARITTYVETDRVRVIALVQMRFSGFGASSTIVADVKDQPAEFYRATHCMVRLKDEDTVGQFQNLKGLGCEIQVCSQLAHVYNELEHDLRYKPLSGALSKRENELLNALARLMEVGDTIINQTREAVEARQREQLVKVENEQDSLGKIAAHIRAYPSLSVVATSPVLLNLVSLVQASHPQGELPETPAELYTAMVRHIMNGARRGIDTKPTPLLDTDELLGSLPSVAWWLFSRDAGAERFDRRTLLDAICSTGHSLNKAEKLLNHLLDLGFLESGHHDNAEQLEFGHGRFRDFLAASHVAAAINRNGWNSADVDAWQANAGWHGTNAGKLLDTHAFEPPWGSVIIFIAGLVREPLRLIEMLADRKRDDLYRNRLGLLCRCYQALSSASQADVARNIPKVFEEILRIAKRCEHDDAGHRKPWMDWVEALLSSPEAAERLCDSLLALNGHPVGVWRVCWPFARCATT